MHSRSSFSGLDFATLEQLIIEIAPFIKLLSFLKSSINPVLSEMAQLLQSWLHHNKAELIGSLSSQISHISITDLDKVFESWLHPSRAELVYDLQKLIYKAGFGIKKIFKKSTKLAPFLGT